MTTASEAATGRPQDRVVTNLNNFRWVNNHLVFAYTPQGDEFERYYAINLAKWATLTFDYQFINNPAYNADRGPVSLLAARIHAEF